MTGPSGEAAWTDYWASAGPGSQGGGCLPKAMQQVEASLARGWREAARSLRRGARVIDLATGDGVVLRAMRAERADLKLIGVDSATVLPPAPRGVSLRSGVRMEKLPFADNHAELVTSQFGYEYGDTARIAGEVVRLLKPSGGLRFVLHHSASPIVAHNLERRRALAWAAVENGLIGKARALATARSRVDIPTPPAFGAAVAEAKRLFPTQDVATEFATAVWQAVELGRRSPPAETLRALSVLEGKAANEMARIDALGGAASDEYRIAGIARELAAAGVRIDEPTTLGENGAGRPLAWLLVGTKPGR